MTVLLAALIVAAAVTWAAVRIAGVLAPRAGGAAAARTAAVDDARLVQILRLFAEGMTAAAGNPRALLVWQPMAVAARQLWPEEFAALDRAFGSRFPFTLDHLQAAHARWTTEWLEWERAHDGECKMKAVALEEELGERRTSAYGRARLDTIEREKLERYQHRYEEYTRTSRALQTLIVAATATASR